MILLLPSLNINAAKSAACIQTREDGDELPASGRVSQYLDSCMSFASCLFIFRITLLCRYFASVFLKIKTKIKQPFPSLFLGFFVVLNGGVASGGIGHVVQSIAAPPPASSFSHDASVFHTHFSLSRDVKITVVDPARPSSSAPASA